MKKKNVVKLQIMSPLICFFHHAGCFTLFPTHILIVPFIYVRHIFYSCTDLKKKISKFRRNLLLI